MKVLLNALIVFLILACNSVAENEAENEVGKINIEWSHDVPGDFSFINSWTYPEGIFKNEFGQLICDGFCPNETANMMDEKGEILADSLDRYYELVDTTHQEYSIQCEAWCYEYAGTNFVSITKDSESVTCRTHMNAATHSSLILKIVDQNCYPTISLQSIAGGDEVIYSCLAGSIQIDKKLWDTGIMKASFDFTFDHTEDPDQPMFWKGNIYQKIE